MEQYVLTAGWLMRMKGDDGKEEIIHPHHLEKAYLTIYEQDKPVNIRIWPKSINPRDKNAIAIDLDIGNWWAHVCYAAPEICKYLSPLSAPRDILELYVLHFKYRID